MTPVHGISPAQNDEATGYPETWKFGEHGDLVAGTFVRFDEGPTRDYGMKVILVLDVDGRERSIWLSQTALFNKVKNELNRRTSKTLEPGERVVVQRHEKTTSENGRSYWPFAVSFTDRPEKSTSELFDLDEGLVVYGDENMERARLKAGPDEPIVDVKTEPSPCDVGSDGDIRF
jgi:hypothetical protein